jgi:hypothetical protein
VTGAGWRRGYDRPPPVHRPVLGSSAAPVLPFRSPGFASCWRLVPHGRADYSSEWSHRSTFGAPTPHPRRAMREIRLCRTPDEAREILDNGGHLYNILTRAGDRVVTRAELDKAAGVHLGGVEAFLHLDLLLSDLAPPAREAVVSLLAPGVRSRYEHERPRPLAIDELDRREDPAVAVQVEGYLEPIGVELRKTGTMVVPVMGGDVGAPFAVPMDESWTVYRISALPGGPSPRTRVAAREGGPAFPTGLVRLVGFLRPRHPLDPQATDQSLLLEPLFFASPVAARLVEPPLLA